jgi:hypothetical protein
LENERHAQSVFDHANFVECIFFQLVELQLVVFQLQFIVIRPVVVFLE